MVYFIVFVLVCNFQVLLQTCHGILDRQMTLNHIQGIKAIFFYMYI